MTEHKFEVIEYNNKKQQDKGIAIKDYTNRGQTKNKTAKQYIDNKFYE